MSIFFCILQTYIFVNLVTFVRYNCATRNIKRVVEIVEPNLFELSNLIAL